MTNVLNFLKQALILLSLNSSVDTDSCNHILCLPPPQEI